MKDLILYNEYHNGDLFYSRILLNMLPKETNIKYFHNCKSSLFCDLINVEEINISHINNFKNINNFPVINTWIGQNNMIYINSINTGCSYENHFFLAKKLTNSLGIQVDDDMDKYIPDINYHLLPNIDNIKTKLNDLKTKFKKFVLISNGDVHSGQATNFDFSPIVNILANLYPDVLFFVTKDILTYNINILNTSKITEVIPDLLQISYISNFCDVIIGRASGPFCFCHTKENLLNKNKVFVSFSKNKYEGIFYQNQKSKYIWHNNYDKDNILNLIKDSKIL